MKILVTIILLSLVLEAQVQKAGGDMTPVVTPFFALSLPGKWKDIESNDKTLWQYESDRGSERLSISVLQHAKPLSKEELRPWLEQYLEVRRRAEVEMARSPQLKLGPTTIREQRNGITATYSGVDPERARQFSSFTVYDIQRVVTFYYEALDVPPDYFEKRTKEVLGKIKIAE
jgi:hypothetical protein